MDATKILENLENCYILNTFSWPELQNFLLMRKCKFLCLVFLFFLAKMAQKMKKHCGADLQLWTGWPSPPIIEEKLAVAFLAKTPNKVLAEAGTCSKVLKIPKYHTEYDNVLKYMDLSISYGKVGFGKI